jgi:deoxycytidylate deaminase
LPQDPETPDRPEIIFALVGAAGARLDDLSAALKDSLSTFGYEAVDIRLSALLVNSADWINHTGTSESDRIRHLQDKGDALRRTLNDGAALARAAIAEIRARRAVFSGSPDRPASARAYIVHQLKHPDEVELLRQVYGSSFLLVAGHAPWELRATELAKRIARKDSRPGEESHFKPQAYTVMEIDEKQHDVFGQNTRDTYPKADFFANLGIHRGEHEVGRFVELLFGHPFSTPSPEEYAMYQASAVSLRSSDDSRQVGAVIVSLTRNNPNDKDKITNADIIAVGMNEVPRAGGGFYWDKDSPDNRDQALLRYREEDRAKEIKISALAELIERLRIKEWLREQIPAGPASELARDLVNELKRTQFMDIGEFSRIVHAEMAALIDAARRGVAVSGHTMYVTTFPCHNCAKHIIAAGIQKVVFLEPYSKSRASHLHEEEINLESADGKVKEDGKVVFFPFSGIGPRLYQQLFSMSERGAKKGFSLKDWAASRRALSPRYVMRNAELAYLPAECKELEKLPTEAYRWNRKTVCPGPTSESGLHDASSKDAPKD